MNQFLIVYRRSSGAIVSIEDLGSDSANALRQRFERERQEAHDPDVEVIVLTAASRDALMQTHARYFKSLGELASSLGDSVAKQHVREDRGPKQ